MKLLKLTTLTLSIACIILPISAMQKAITVTQEERKALSDESGRTPLLQALHFRNLDVADKLIISGADINAVDAQGKTALHYIVRITSEKNESHRILLQKLIKGGIDINAESHEGCTALDYADSDYFEELVALGAHYGAGRKAPLHESQRLLRAQERIQENIAPYLPQSLSRIVSEYLLIAKSKEEHNRDFKGFSKPEQCIIS